MNEWIDRRSKRHKRDYSSKYRNLKNEKNNTVFRLWLSSSSFYEYNIVLPD